MTARYSSPQHNRSLFELPPSSAHPLAVLHEAGAHRSTPLSPSPSWLAAARDQEARARAEGGAALDARARPVDAEVDAGGAARRAPRAGEPRP
eukprot:6912994-Prymnesium_polylepis.1